MSPASTRASFAQVEVVDIRDGLDAMFGDPPVRSVPYCCLSSYVIGGALAAIYLIIDYFLRHAHR